MGVREIERTGKIGKKMRYKEREDEIVRKKERKREKEKNEEKKREKVIDSERKSEWLYIIINVQCTMYNVHA